MKRDAARPTLVSPAYSEMSVDGIEDTCHLIGEFHKSSGEIRQ